MARPCVTEIKRREIACDAFVAYLRKYEYDIVLPRQRVEDMRVQEMADDDVVVDEYKYLHCGFVLDISVGFKCGVIAGTNNGSVRQNSP